MPCDVTMVQPHAWIVGGELDDQVPIPGQHVHVAAQWVGGVDDRMTVPGTETCGQDRLQS